MSKFIVGGGGGTVVGGGTGDMAAATWDSDSNGAIDVAKGGTNATTAAQAKTNLSAASSGANADITSLAGLTTALTVGQGGTGANSAAGARTNLGLGSLATKSAVSESDLALTDITTGDASTSQHGLRKKFTGDPAQQIFEDGNVYSQPWYWAKLGFIFEDFIGGQANSGVGSFALLSTGSGAQATFSTADTTAVGIATLSTGTTTTGITRIGVGSSGNFATITLGSGVAYFETRFRLTQLSNGTDTFTIRLGLGDSVSTSDPTDGVYLRYTDGVNSGNFQLVTRANNVETITDTGVTAVAATWYKLKITVAADGSSVTMNINGATVSATTNIPTGTARATSLGSSIYKSAGTTSVTVDLDYIAFTYNFTSSR